MCVLQISNVSTFQLQIGLFLHSSFPASDVWRSVAVRSHHILYIYAYTYIYIERERCILHNIQLTPQKLSAGRINRTSAKGASAFFFFFILYIIQLFYISNVSTFFSRLGSFCTLPSPPPMSGARWRSAPSCSALCSTPT